MAVFTTDFVSFVRLATPPHEVWVMITLGKYLVQLYDHF